MTSAALLDRATAPLDRARRAVLRVLLATPVVAPLMSRRDSRVALWASGHAAVAFLLTALFPMLLFVLGPVLLGVAHVAADVRYLVVRRKLPAWWKNAVWIGCASLIGVRAVQELGVRGHGAMRVELLFACGWVGLALFAGARAAGRSGRALLAVPILGAVAWAAVAAPTTVRLWFVHVHNVVAVVLWLYLFRRRLIAAIIPLVVMAAAIAYLMTARTFAWAEQVGGLQAFRLHLLIAADWVAPGLTPRNAVGLTLVYTFLQSIHYSALLLLIPQEDTRGETTLTFRASARSLLADFGWRGVLAIVLAAVAVLVGAFANAQRARALYLSLAMFHGYLELTMLAYFWSRGRREPSSVPAGGRSAALPAVSGA